MPNPIKYNISTQTLALKKGNFWIGTNDVSKGPSSNTDYWNGIKPPTGGYTIYLNKASQGPSIYVAASDAELITITNKIAGTSYTTINECFTYYSTQTDKMVLNKDYETIITSGLTLCLDAGFIPSYPKSGTTWYDLSSNGYNGTLTNGPTFDNDSSSIIFDGVNDYITIGSVSNFSFIQNTGIYTISAWVKPSVLGTAMYFAGNNSGTSNAKGFYFGKESTNNCWLAITNGSGTILSHKVSNFFTNTTDWVNVTCVGNSTTNQFYRNGVAFGSTSNITNLSSGDSSQILALGSINNVLVFNWWWNGGISNFQVYNRALSISEVSQNFFALVPIVRNGLVFNLVAGNPISYVSGSINWIDTIGGSSGVLTNGPTFTSSGSSSSLVFDGSNDAIIWSSDPLSSLTSAKTYELWVKFSSTIVNTFTISCGTYEVYLENKTTWYINQTGAANSYVSWTFNSGWTHFVYSFDGSNHLCYINGVSYTINFGSGVSSQTNLYIGNRVNMDSPMKGDIAITRMYNRGLSATEILQNYNSQKSVFGL